MAHHKSAAVRSLGIRARFGYLLGAIFAAIWTLIYSVPKLTPIVTNLSEHRGQALLLAAAIAACFTFLCEEAHHSPVGVPALRVMADPIGVLGVVAFIGYMAFYFPTQETFDRVLAVWDIENKTEGTQRLGWVGAGWIGLIVVSLPAGLIYLLFEKVVNETVAAIVSVPIAAICFVLAFIRFGHPAHLTLPLLVVFVPSVLFVALPFFMSLREYVKEHPIYRKTLLMGRGGAARFGGIYSFLKYDFTFVMNPLHSRKGPIYAGMTTLEADPKLGRRHIGLDSDAMMLTVASMGGGKSLFAAWNTLLLWRGGALILDPKGEHARRTGAERQKFGNVYYIDPWGVLPEDVLRNSLDGMAATFNPLTAIDLDHVNARDDLMQIVEACILQEPGETANSKHFRENAQKIMLGVMAHVLSEFGREHHNLPSIYDTLLTGHPDGGASDPQAFEDLITAMAVNEAFGRAPMDAAKVLGEAGPNERGGFVTSVATGLSWVNSPALRPVLKPEHTPGYYGSSGACFMSSIRVVNATVYLVVPFENMGPHARFLRTVVSMALLATRKPAKKDLKTLILLDEFPQLGTFGPIKEGLVTLRSRNVKIWMHLQNVGQLKERYKNWQDFMSSCDKQFFAVNDLDTATAISKELGEYVERWVEGPEGATRAVDKNRPLRSPSEVSEDLRKGSGIQYVLPSDGSPLRLKLVPFYKNFRKYGKLEGE